MQNRITEKDRLLDENGKLKHKGYATELLLNYDRNDIKGGKLRIKEWDYYLINNNKFALALTIADNSYMGLNSVSLIDFEKGAEITKSFMSFMPNGKTNLPSTSLNGNVEVKTDKIELIFKNDNGKRELYAFVKNFKDGLSLKAKINIEVPKGDSMVIATPFPKDDKAFYYNQKIIGMKAFGEICFGDNKIILGKDDTFALLDWGRGVWTYKNTWYWSAAATMQEGKVFGFNLGYGFGDTSAATENMLFYNGTAHKLDNVNFGIPKNNKGEEDYLKEWIFTSDDNRLEMKFQPILDRKSYTSALIICSDQHQVFGRFNGKAILDDGSIIEVKNMYGFAEKVFNKW